MKEGSLFFSFSSTLIDSILSIINCVTKHVTFYSDLPTFPKFFTSSWMPGCRRNLDSGPNNYKQQSADHWSGLSDYNPPLTESLHGNRQNVWILLSSNYKSTVRKGKFLSFKNVRVLILNLSAWILMNGVLANMVSFLEHTNKKTKCTVISGKPCISDMK